MKETNIFDYEESDEKQYEHLNIMCVTDDVEELKKMQFIVSKKYMILIIKK